MAATIHDAPDASGHSGGRQFLMRFFSNRLSHLVCVSDAVHQAWSRRQITVPMSVIRNGILDLSVQRHLSQLPVVGFLGMHSPMKGFSHVVQWAESLPGSDMEWRLYGDVHPSLASVVQELARNKRVVVRGRQPQSVIFSEIDILVHPSTEFDSLPTALIEAARAGIPAVASDIGGSGEIVEHGRTGFLFPADAPDQGLQFLKDLLFNEEHRARLGKSARQCYEKNYKACRMAEAYSRFWDELAAL